MNDNKAVYSTVEFESWAHRSSLILAEEFLINKYLDKKGKTLEAGTGGGRIILELQSLGYESLYGFDYVPEFIDQAKSRDKSNTINFAVQNATNLNYEIDFFDNLIYLQQVICFIEEDSLRKKAIEEAYRILKPGGTALFSFLSYEARITNKMYSMYMKYLKILRKMKGSDHKLQYLPWLKLGNKPNIMAIIDKGPYVYWYKLEEIEQILKEAGFIIKTMGTGSSINRGIMYNSRRELMNDQLEGMVYFVCTK